MACHKGSFDDMLKGWEGLREWEKCQRDVKEGWLCPRCGIVNSPVAQQCSCTPRRFHDPIAQNQDKTFYYDPKQFTNKECGMHQHVKA